MSFYKNNSNRIPKGAVAISETYYKLTSKDVIGEVIDVEEEMKKEKEQNELLMKQNELIELENQLTLLKNNVESNFALLEKEKREFQENMIKEKTIFEHQKRKDYYEMRSFIWNKSVELAEEILKQNIDKKTISPVKIFDGMIKQLPVAFEELTVSVNPETLDYIEKVEDKDKWVFGNVNWKIDYSLRFGEFIVEEDNEFYDYTYNSLFAEVKARIEDNRRMESEKND